MTFASVEDHGVPTIEIIVLLYSSSNIQNFISLPGIVKLAFLYKPMRGLMEEQN